VVIERRIDGGGEGTGYDSTVAYLNEGVIRRKQFKRGTHPMKNPRAGGAADGEP